MLTRFLPLVFLLACGGCGPPSHPWEGPWLNRAGVDHPLVGGIWADGAFVTPEALVERLAQADFVLLGEQHDHADHHRIQAQLAALLVRPGSRQGGLGLPRPTPRVALFEMLDDEDCLPLGACNAERGGPAPPPNPKALAVAVDWQNSGWPDFELYAPIFRVLFDAQASILPAHPNRAILKQVMTEGLAGWPQAAELGLQQPLPDPHPAELAQEIREAHCGHAPERLVQPMIDAQRVKDAWMARRMAEAGRTAPVVLFAGNGHVRRDRGVPTYLPLHDPRPVLSVGLLPVVSGQNDPRDYPVEAYDFVIFTPRESDVDPCERFREQLEAMKKKPAKP